MKPQSLIREEKGLVGIVRRVDLDLQQQGFVLNSSVAVDHSYLGDSFEPLDDFFEENSTALAVAQQRASYTNLIKPITEHYGTIKSRLLSPKLDRAFDSYTHDILSSLNQVGISTVDPTIFMTETRQRALSSQRRDALVMGGAVGIGESIGARLLDSNLPPFATNILFPLVILPLFLGVHVYSQNDECNRELKHLESAARATDGYLRYVGEKYL